MHIFSIFRRKDTNEIYKFTCPHPPTAYAVCGGSAAGGQFSMMKKQEFNINDFLTGTRILEEVESPINGKITVIKSLAFGTHIQVGGITQSGGVVEDIWKTVLKKVKNPPPSPRLRRTSKSKVQKCLILGLGGGSAAKLVRKYWPASAKKSSTLRLRPEGLRRGEPEVKITGVDIDPLMIEMGKKYMGLGKFGVKIEIGDALKKVQSSKSKYDLILVDTYLGDNYPEKFESNHFLELVLKSLSPAGIAVFNRLYFGEKRSQAMKFGDKLEKIFSKVERVFPEANVMFVCFE